MTNNGSHFILRIEQMLLKIKGKLVWSRCKHSRNQRLITKVAWEELLQRRRKIKNYGRKTVTYKKSQRFKKTWLSILIGLKIETESLSWYFHNGSGVEEVHIVLTLEPALVQLNDNDPCWSSEQNRANVNTGCLSSQKLSMAVIFALLKMISGVFLSWLQNYHLLPLGSLPRGGIVTFSLWARSCEPVHISAWSLQ